MQEVERVIWLSGVTHAHLAWEDGEQSLTLAHRHIRHEGGSVFHRHLLEEDRDGGYYTLTTTWLKEQA